MITFLDNRHLFFGDVDAVSISKTIDPLKPSVWTYLLPERKLTVEARAVLSFFAIFPALLAVGLSKELSAAHPDVSVWAKLGFGSLICGCLALIVILGYRSYEDIDRFIAAKDLTDSDQYVDIQCNFGYTALKNALASKLAIFDVEVTADEMFADFLELESTATKLLVPYFQITSGVLNLRSAVVYSGRGLWNDVKSDVKILQEADYAANVIHMLMLNEKVLG